jgi:PAS domain S-box-containing protein
MTLLSVLHVLAFVFNIWCIVLVLNRKPITRINYYGAFIFCCFLIWSLAQTFMNLSDNVPQAFIWMNISAIGWVTFPLAGFLFNLSLNDTDKKILQNKYLLALALIPSLFLFYEQWCGRLINSVELGSYGWFGVWADSYSSIFFFLYYSVMAIASIILCWNLKNKASGPRQKRQAILLTVTAIATFLLGSTTNVILPKLNIYIFPQIADVFGIIWGAGVAISITKYGLLGLTPSTAAETIVDTMGESLMIVDKKGKIVLVNRAVKNLFGNKVELEGKYFTSIVTEKARAEKFLKEASTHNYNANQELTYKIPDGREIPMLVSSSIIRNLKEPELGIVIIARDISQRKQFESELREQKKLTDGILETMPNSLILIGYDLKIKLVNKAFTDLLKIPNHALSDIEITAVFPTMELLRTIDNIVRNRENGNSCEFRYKIDDLEKVFRANVLKMGAENLLIILSDVTIERQIQEKVYLRDRLATVGEMASSICYQLNNPLTSVLAISRSLKEQDLPGGLGEDIDLLTKEAQRAAVIVKNMLSFARKPSPMKQPTQVNMIIEEIIKIRAYEHMVSNIFVQTILADDLPAVTADYFQIQQVFLNIILNAEYAITASKKRGCLVLKTELENGYVKVSISDNGTGISRKNLTRVFDPFFTTKGEGKGTGLGLSISYGIITSHNGRINVLSESGKGSTFIVELPVRSDSLAVNAVTDQIKKDAEEALVTPIC